MQVGVAAAAGVPVPPVPYVLEERDVQIRGYPIKFDVDVLVLFSAKFFKDLAHVGCFLAIVEQGADFGFRGGCHDVFHNSTFDVDWAIGCWVVSWLIGVA